MILRPQLIDRLREGHAAILIRPGSSTEPFGRARHLIEWEREATWEDTPEERERGIARVNEETHLQIVAQERLALDQVDDQRAKQAGFRSRHLFLEHWAEQGYRAGGEVWVVTLTVDRTDKGRYITNPIAGKQGDYTSSPSRAIDELEAVSALTQAEFSKEARHRGELLRAEQKLRERARSVGRRLREEALRAGRAGVDVSSELTVIEGALEQITEKREAA